MEWLGAYHPYLALASTLIRPDLSRAVGSRPLTQLRTALAHTVFEWAGPSECNRRPVVGFRLGGDLLTPIMSFMVHRYSIRHELYPGYVFDYEETASLFWQCHF